MRAKLRQMTVPEVKAYYAAQHPLRCALFGHKFYAVMDERAYCCCMRCQGEFKWGSGNPSLYQWLVLRPTYPLRRWWGIKRDQWRRLRRLAAKPKP